MARCRVAGAAGDVRRGSSRPLALGMAPDRVRSGRELAQLARGAARRVGSRKESRGPCDPRELGLHGGPVILVFPGFA